MDNLKRSGFITYIFESNISGSGKASSYLRALDLLSEMLQIKAFGFDDCVDIWAVTSLHRLAELKALVTTEQSKKGGSEWLNLGIPKSYLLNGYCKAALSCFEKYLLEKQQEDDLMQVFAKHQGNGNELANLLNVEPQVIDVLLDHIKDPMSAEGEDVIRKVKTRRNQHLFRRMLIDIYGGSCCITGLNIPEINRASHIVSWAEDPAKRLDPSNGLYLSATYDAAFDKHLISLDDDYRIILSSDIKGHYMADSVNEYFIKKEGQRIILPSSYLPNKKYLAKHRNIGKF